MKNEIFNALLGYKSAMAQARILRSKDMMTAKEYSKIEQKMCQMFGINSDSIYREIEWINR